MTNLDGNSKLSAIDEALGAFSEHLTNPFFGLQAPGVQWPEERSFARTANVFALARLAQVLVGFQGCVMYGANLSGAGISLHEIDKESRFKYAKAAAELLECLVTICPQILSEIPVVSDSEWGLPPYIADERMRPVIEQAIARAREEKPDENF